MPLVLADRVRETTTTTGQGTVTLAGAVTGFQSFSVIGNGNTTYYTIAGQNTSEWEVGIGTYTSSGTTLSRDTVLASSAGAPTKTNFSAGTKDVFVTYTAARSVNVDGTSIDTFGLGAAQGDILYASATDNFVRLAKDTNATRYLANTGTTNNPAWAQINLANGVTGTLPIANGGSGQTTAQAAMNAFAGAVTSGSYLRGNGTNVVMSTIQAADVPTLNQSTTGNAATATNVAGLVANTFTTYGNTATSTAKNSYYGVLLGNATTHLNCMADTSGNGGFYRESNSVWPMYYNVTNGSVGIMGSTTSSGIALYVNGAVTATGNVTAFSDERYKTNWRSVRQDFVQGLAQVRSGIYDRTDEEVTQVGVSAQSLQNLLPEAVVCDDGGRLSVAYGNAALVACVELAKELVKLRAEVKALKKGA